ncbi:MAG TPA: D-aminoacyl-tRNA deacylase [Acidimicrobiia bacterium]
MRAVVSRVSSASVVVGGELVGAIGPGLLVLVGVAGSDSEAEADALAGKLTGLRIFDDGHGRMNRSVTDVGGAVLVVSQFTLLAETARGRRPSFTGAADPAVAEPLVARLVAAVNATGIATATGRFGARMQVSSVNDGPVTILLEVAGGRVR